MKIRKKKEETADKPDRLFDIIVIKMMLALTLSVSFLFGGGTLFIYSAFNSIEIEGYSPIVGSFLGIHAAMLLLYYSIAFFRYIITD
ncbi:MAG: hypothetical protein ACTSQE_06270 [Candidatus Heimdallarchaeaceae archaeon]